MSLSLIVLFFLRGRGRLWDRKFSSSIVMGGEEGGAMPGQCHAMPLFERHVCVQCVCVDGGWDALLLPLQCKRKAGERQAGAQ